MAECVKFAPSDRDKIAQLLLLDPRSAAAGAGIDAIEKILSRSHRLEQEDAPDLKRFPRSRGRPPSIGINRDQTVAVLAYIYEYTTGSPVKNSSSHPFYTLLQICLHQADPAKLIKIVTESYWRPDNTEGLIGGMMTDALEYVNALRAAGFKPPWLP